ncbi:MAG: phenylalanine--tRNA ligase subunit beta [Ignavibacteriales bacterium]|nr:phenylalanine--tRNA ligase subunit beta [Ignavibacteriales bacterium]
MKISLNWLKEYIDLSDITTEEISDKLTAAGLEIEEIIDQRKVFQNFVVGYVKEKQQHPNADKLSLCKVTDGQNIYNVICGAPNVDAGQKIPLAKIGATIPENNFKISKAKIRGEVSEGMICSERELGISDNHAGIMVLNENVKVGNSLSDELGLDDVIFDINVTPNRSDALSHIGIARDLSAIFNKPLKIPEIKLKESERDINELASVEILNSHDCPRYFAKVVTDVKIKESPEWLKKKLFNIGLRPINNIVDITNFVLYETGQPLHAFDLDLLTDKKIIVRNEKSKIKFTTLDNKEREIIITDLMICDGKRPVAIAGVMGGQNSEVTNNTKNVLIESAHFNSSAIRKTSKRLGLSTDASYRFERTVDPNIPPYAAERAAQLMIELADGKVVKGLIDIYPEKIQPKKVSLRFNRVTRILGFEIPKESVLLILKNLQFSILKSDDSKIEVQIPTFRPDIEREIDLIEEIVRIYGYDRIPPVQKISITLEERIYQDTFNDRLRDILVSLGFFEIFSNSMQKEENANKFGKAINVLNPKSYEMASIRTSLIPGMLMTIKKNLNVQEKNLRFFEIGQIFNRGKDGEIKDFSDFIEESKLLLGITGKATESEWYEKDRQFDFYDLKESVEQTFEFLFQGVQFVDLYHKEGNNFFEYYFEREFKGNKVGIGGKIRQDVLEYFNITQDVFVFDVNLDILKQIQLSNKRYNELLKYPKVVRDFALIIDKKIDNSDVMKFIFKNSINILKNIKLFDIFESVSLGKDVKSLAYQLEFWDNEKTLTEEEVDKYFWDIIEKTKNEFNAKLRGE